MALADDMVGHESIMPDEQNLDLNEIDPLVNAMVLGELVNRTVKGSSLIEGMAEYIMIARHVFQQRFLMNQLG